MVPKGDLTFRALNKLAKWRSWYAGWQLGTRSDTDPECKAVKDHREITIVMRVELNALTGLLISKGILTVEEWDAALGKEAIHYDSTLSEQYPGVTSTEFGLNYTKDAVQTMTKLNFKP